MRNAVATACVIATFFALSGCDDFLMSSPTFALPDGDVEHGQELFSNLQCTACHRIDGLEFPAAGIERPYDYLIGGKVSKIKSYEELVTSVINPSHRLAPSYQRDQGRATGDSPMTNYNDVMTVSELVDIVAFLHSRYDQLPPVRYHHAPYVFPQ